MSSGHRRAGDAGSSDAEDTAAGETGADPVGPRWCRRSSERDEDAVPGPLGAIVTRYFVPLALVVVAYGGAEHLLYLIASWGQGAFRQDFGLASFYVTYAEFGFVKRGLVATVLAPVLSALPVGGFWSIAFVAAFQIVGVIALILLTDRLIARHFTPRGGVYVRLVVLLSPAALAQSGFHYMRFDHLVFLALAFAGFAAAGGRHLLAGSVLALGVLVHEMTVVFAGPLILAAAFVRGATWREIARLAAPPAMAALAVAFFGETDIDMKAELPARFHAATMIWSRPLFQPAAPYPAWQYGLLAFYLFVPGAMLASFYRQNGFVADLLLLAPVASLAFFAFGVDYFRWCNVFLVAVVATIMLKAAAHDVRIDWRPRGALLVSLVLYSLPLGPIGIMRPLPHVEWAIGRFT